MKGDFHIIIPARYQSTRFPGKLLKELAGKTIIQRVYEQAVLAHPQSIVIAVDDERIAKHARTFGADVVMTDIAHVSGTDRLAEVITKRCYAQSDIIVNVQGDEPFIAPELIQQAANSLQNSEAPAATLCWPIENQEKLFNPNIVKVVRDRFNQALYFSRSPIPCNRDNSGSFEHVFRHIGLYAYRAGFLQEFVQLPHCALENCEMLEQLRIIWAGFKIQVETACMPPLPDINTEADFINACAIELVCNA